MLLSGSATLAILIVIGVFFAFWGVSRALRLARWVLGLPGRAVRGVMAYVAVWRVHRAEIRAAQARALEAEERLRNEQIRDLFKR